MIGTTLLFTRSKEVLRIAIFLCIVLTADAAFFSKPEVANASEQFRYFPETDHIINQPLFLEYWQNNGGLTRFGYPMNDSRTEESTFSRKEVSVQYFERAEFEL